MSRYMLKALTGPVKGQVFLIKQGLTIGRFLGDILLEDNSVSKTHAEIKIYSSGKMMIIDKDSRNKIFIDNKKTVKSILEKGTKFKIGKTEFEVILTKTSEEIVCDFIEKNIEEIKDQSLNLKSFFQAIELTFLSGRQKGTIYSLSYGPRFFGSESVDFPIFEKQSPKKAFTFVPEASSTYFVTSYSDIVRFNGKSIKKTNINHGDKIIIGEVSLQIALK